MIGGGSKKNLFYLILKEYNSEEAIQAMLRLCRVSSFYISKCCCWEFALRRF